MDMLGWYYAKGMLTTRAGEPELELYFQMLVEPEQEPSKFWQLQLVSNYRKDVAVVL